MLRTDITEFDDALEYIGEMIGSDFLKAFALAQDIEDNTSKYTGVQAGIAAMRMANYRYKIGLVAQQWKIQSAQTKKLSDRLIKDALMCAYDGLAEVINTLKLVARHEHDLTSAR